MLVPNKKEPYRFEICPTKRVDFKSVITFKLSEWPVKDVDSDGEETVRAFYDEKPPQFTLLFTCDLRLQPAACQWVVELEAHACDWAVLCMPLSNPLSRWLEFNVIKNGNFLEVEDQFEVPAKGNLNYFLKSCSRK
jgi:hypothetical protein